MASVSGKERRMPPPEIPPSKFWTGRSEGTFGNWFLYEMSNGIFLALACRGVPYWRHHRASLVELSIDAARRTAAVLRERIDKGPLQETGNDLIKEALMGIPCSRSVKKEMLERVVLEVTLDMLKVCHTCINRCLSRWGERCPLFE